MTVQSLFARSNHELGRKLDIGFLGGGLGSAVGGAHFDAITLTRKFNLAAGCFNRNPRRNMETGAEYGVSPERTYANLGAMLNAEADKLDAMVVLTPTDQHGEQVLACINASMPVICEKALAHSGAEIEAIKHSLADKSGFLSVISNYTGYPMLRELAHIVKREDLGRITQIRAEMPQEGFLKVKTDNTPFVPQDWRLRDGEVPTVSLDLGVHLHMIIQFLTGQEPLTVNADYNRFGNFKVVDDVECSARYTGDMKAHLWYGKAALGKQNGLRIVVFGTRGSVEWYQMQPEILYCADMNGRQYTLYPGHPDIQAANDPRYGRFKPGHPAGFIEALANYYVDVEDALRAHIKNETTDLGYVFGVDDALAGHNMFRAMSASVTTGRVVEVKRDSVAKSRTGLPQHGALKFLAAD